MKPAAHTYPDRSAWLAGRAETNRTRLGASEVAAVLGLSPHAGPWDVWGRRNGIEPKQTASMAAGLAWEGAVLAQYAAARGVSLLPGAGLSVWAGSCLSATPDAVVLHVPSDARWLVEVKCPSEFGPDAKTWFGHEPKRDDPARETLMGGEVVNRILAGTVPPLDQIGNLDPMSLGCPVGYWVQVQAQLDLVGLDRADLVGFFGPQHVVTVEIERDATWMQDARWVLEAWVERHLIGIDEQGFVNQMSVVEPDRDHSDACVRWLLSKLKEGERPATAEEVEAMAEALAGAAVEAEGAERRKAARARLAESLARDGARKVWAPGCTASVSRVGVLSIRGGR